MSQEEEREVFPFPGKVKSSVWEFFGFYKDDYGNLDKSRAICKLCRRGTNYSGNTTNLRTHIVHHHKNVAALPDFNYSRAQLSRSTTSQSQEANFSATFLNQIATSPDGYSHTTTPKMQRQMVFDEILIPPLSSDITGSLNRNPTQQNAWVMETATGLIDSQAVYNKESPGQENSSGSFADSETESYGGPTSIKDAVFETVIQDLIPIETVDSPRFKKLISAGKRHFLIQSSKDISNLILKRHSELKEIISNELLQSNYKSLKIEIWRSCDFSYMTVSIQALFDNWKMRCYVLNTMELQDRFSEKDLGEMLDKGKGGIALEEKVILSDENSVIEKLADVKKCMHIVALCNVIDKVANLCIKENVGKSLIRKVQKVVRFFNENKDAKAIFSEKQKILHLPDKCLVDCNEKNWETCLTSFEHILEQSNAVIASFNDAKVQAVGPSDELSSSDFALLQTFINMLVPLKTALTLTKDMKYPTAAVILPVLKKLELSMACRETDSQQVVDLKTKMVAVLKQSYEAQDKKQFLLLCSLLDPRFKGLKFVSQSDQDVAYEHLKREAIGVRSKRRSAGETDTQMSDKCIVKIEVCDDYTDSQGTAFDTYLKNSEEAEGSSSMHQKAKRQKLSEKAPKATCSDSATDDWFADVIQEVKEGKSEEDSVVMEISQYKGEMQISSASSPLSWWRDRQKSFPLLSRVAMRYVSVPALQGTKDVISEKWYRRQRSCISPHLVDPIIFLHANYEKIKRLGDEM